VAVAEAGVAPAERRQRSRPERLTWRIAGMEASDGGTRPGREQAATARLASTLLKIFRKRKHDTFV
jgi:hypothetical protein